jgi:hypothetical protein
MYPPAREFSFSLAAPDGQSGPVTCAACGCRLEGSQDGAMYRHFNPLGGRDARGCRIACADLAHDASGHVLGD